MITYKNILDAQKTLENIVTRTNLVYSKTISNEVNANVYLKTENLQKTGSFKIRGSYNRISKLSEFEKQKGIVAVSAGNHAQGVSYSAKKFGITANILMPEYAPISKVIATQSYGSNVFLKGKNIEETMELSKKFIDQGNIFIHPFDDPYVIAGQGTIALEMLEDIPNLDVIFVPIGGGGLISGISICAKHINPNIKIIGVETELSYNAKCSYSRGELICSNQSMYSLADGIAVGKYGLITNEIIKMYVDEIITVSEYDVATAIFIILEKSKILVEGAGSVGIAGLLARKDDYKNKNVGVVLSGGNIDLSILQSVIDKGLKNEGRKIEFSITMQDKPGELKRVTHIICEMGANIYSVSHDRLKDGIRPGFVSVGMILETKNKIHTNNMFRILIDSGYEVVLQ